MAGAKSRRLIILSAAAAGLGLGVSPRAYAGAMLPQWDSPPEQNQNAVPDSKPRHALAIEAIAPQFTPPHIQLTDLVPALSGDLVGWHGLEIELPCLPFSPSAIPGDALEITASPGISGVNLLVLPPGPPDPLPEWVPSLAAQVRLKNPRNKTPAETDDQITESLPGMLSEAALRDIDRRVLRRIANMRNEKDPRPPASPEALTLQFGAIFDNQDTQAASSLDDGVDRAAALTNEAEPAGSEAMVDSPEGIAAVDTVGTGAGGGSGTAGAVAQFVLPSPVSKIGNPSLGPFASVALTVAGGSVSRPYLTSLPLPVASSGASAAAPAVVQISPTAGVLPYGVRGYSTVDLQPMPNNWVSSEAVHINGGRLGGLVTDLTGTITHAAIWNLSVTGFIDMQPASAPFSGSRINDINGAQSVGSATGSGSHEHAVLWTSANPSSMTDLNPAGYISSYAEATTGVKQIGYGYPTATPDTPHALMWSGSAASFFDLNPTGFLFSYALGGDANHQVGYGQNAQSNLHALAWSGSANSFVDIHPTSNLFYDSRAVSVSGNEAGGYGTSLEIYQHAILWTALNGASAIDINPDAFSSSQITGMNGSSEVGFGTLLNDISGNTHALLWNSTGTGYLDLNAYLPSNYISAKANGIDAAGNIVGVARDSITGNLHAVEWVASLLVPEPSSFTAAAGLLALACFRPRRRSRSPIAIA